MNSQSTNLVGTRPSRILVCRPNGRLGNTLLVTPLIQELEALFPGAEIDIVTACGAAFDIFRQYRSVRTIYFFPKRTWWRPVRAFLDSRRTRYDLVIDVCAVSWTGRMWARAMRGAAKVGFVGMKHGVGLTFGLNERSAPPHMAQSPVDLVRKAFAAGLSGDARPMPLLDVKLTAAEREFGADKLGQLIGEQGKSTPVLGVFANATGAKNLSAEFWIELVRRLRAEHPAMRVVEILPADGRARLPNYPGYFSTDVRRMAAVIGALDWFVSADCGVMHLGVASGAPTLGLFVASDVAKYAPYGGRNAAIVIGSSPDQAIDEVAARLRGG